MQQKNVKIGSDLYQLTAVSCEVSGAIAVDLISNFLPLLVAFADRDIELLNKELRTSIQPDKVMRIVKELINPMVLLKNNDLINDWTEEFACKPFTLFKLAYEALRFNCEDFFTFMSGFAKENNLGQNWQEIIQNLKKEGVEIPQVFSQVLQSGEEIKEQVEPKE